MEWMAGAGREEWAWEGMACRRKEGGEVEGDPRRGVQSEGKADRRETKGAGARDRLTG